MTTHQLGPEKPRPLSVLSEDHLRRRLVLPYIPHHELYSFGVDYEKRLCCLIDQYLFVDTCDKICYVGEIIGSVAPLLQDRFCVLEPIISIEPGMTHYEETPNHKMVPVRLENVGVEHFFSTEHRLNLDKVILFDTLCHLTDYNSFFNSILENLNETGKILIIHRATPMNTLPMFSQAIARLQEYEQSYARAIESLKSLGLEVCWEIETLPVHTNKEKWLTMLKNRFPPELQIVSDYEIMEGLRELSEGSMKYSNNQIEFLDRLLFIVAQRPVFQYPHLSRKVATNQTAQNKVCWPQPIHFQMPITDEVALIVKDQERKRVKVQPRNLFL